MKSCSELVELIPVKKRFDDKYFRAKKIIDDWERIRTKVENILERGVFNRTVVAECAWAVLVMMETGIRVGNEKSAEGYLCVNAYSKKFNQRVKTYGVTTLLRKHCMLRGNKFSKRLYLNFIGKKLIEQSFVIENEIIIDAFEWLFLYKPGPVSLRDTLLSITHYDLTKFVKRYIGRNFSIKDIRTARVNYTFIETIMDVKIDAGLAELTRKSDANKIASEMMEITANKIGHTKQVCKSRYVSPNLFEYYKEYLYELIERNKEET